MRSLAGQSASRRPGVRGLLTGVLLLVALVAAVVSVLTYRREVLAALGVWSPAEVALAAGFALVVPLLAAASWRALLTNLGCRLPVLAAARVFLVGQLGKYLPGGLWMVLAQAEVGRRYGVPVRTSASASLLTVMVSVSAGITVGLLGVPSLIAGAGMGEHSRWLPVAGLAAVAVVAATHPRVSGPALDLALRLVRRPALDRRPTVAGTARALAWAVASWWAAGLMVWVLVVGLGAPRDLQTLLLCVGGYCLAWTAGTAVVVLPAGAGAREVVLLIVLAPVLERPEALTVALVSRVLMTLADVALAGLAAIPVQAPLGGASTQAPLGGASTQAPLGSGESVEG